MKMLPILVPGVLAGVLVSAMVFAAPLAEKSDDVSFAPMDRAAAYKLASAN